MAEKPYQIVDLNFVSLYFLDFEKAVAFYTDIFGEPDQIYQAGPHYGWKLGATWLTLFESKVGTAVNSNPHNTEFAIQMAEPGEVDRLYHALIAAGCQPIHTPEDTEMYVPMHYCCVDDPFGVRIDVYCFIDSPMSE
ncbi:MAG: hypothetical protein H6654_01675 [Ardenticatenaceae bacterium]|nr:hypothetical protein [Anaerolineales bacterium]MCB8940894.1 hypothetical protein [Ardenticatenaceae bacterium]MCB8972233.1 hypothetical protein [Ardenticatenaceae bacterium]